MFAFDIAWVIGLLLGVLLSLLLSLTALQACGTRGPLTLPPQQEKAAQTAPQAARALFFSPFFWRGKEKSSPAGARPGQQNQNQANNKK